MEEISDLTYAVAAFPDIPDFVNTDICIDWAEEMIISGYESDSLLILGSMLKPADYFETLLYLKRSFTELGLKFKTGKDAIISYTGSIMIRLANGKDIYRNLRKLFFEFGKPEYDNIFDFYLLYWAYDDFRCGMSYSDYWQGAKPETIDIIIIEKANEWLVENRDKFEVILK
jgi:hypothetical protein